MFIFLLYRFLLAEGFMCVRVFYAAECVVLSLKIRFAADVQPGLNCVVWFFLLSLLANSRVELCRTDDLMPTSLSLAFLQAVLYVDAEVQGLKVIIDCQVVLGRPTGLLHSAGGLSAAAMTR